MNLPDDLATALEDKLWDLMCKREYSQNGPDETVCMFCQNSARDIKGKCQEIKHDADCVGVRLRVEFDKC